MKLILLVLLSTLVFTEIQEQTFRKFVQATFDLDGDGKFNYQDWVSYYLFLQHDLKFNNPYLKQTFDEYDLNKDSIVTIDEMLKLTITIPIKLGPKQLHLGLTGNDGQMQIMWVTQPDRYFKPIVKYGESEHSLKNTVEANWTTYNQGKIGFHGRIYRAVMTGLKPHQKYYYKVGDHLLGMFSKPHSFISAPNKGTYLDRIHFSAVGDMGTYAPKGHQVTNVMYDHGVKDPYDFVFLNGDIAYAGMSSEKVGQIEPIWDLFGQQIQKIAAKVPFMPGVGNHEKYYNFSAFSNRYYLPRSEGSFENFWFSFDYGQLHLIHLSSQHDFNKGSPQYQFLQNDLQKASTNGYTKWIMVAAHRPFYSSDKDGFSNIRPIAKQLQELVNQYKVDIVQTGHEHSYERTWPVYQGHALFQGSNTTHYVNPSTPVYVVQGTGGAMIRYRFTNPAPQWSMRRQNKWGFGNIQIKNNTLKYQFIDTTGKVVDEWKIIK